MLQVVRFLSMEDTRSGRKELRVAKSFDVVIIFVNNRNILARAYTHNNHSLLLRETHMVSSRTHVKPIQVNAN
jgi:hypothetical protein